MDYPSILLGRGLHVLHLFYNIDRAAWNHIDPAERDAAWKRLEAIQAANAQPSHPRLTTYATVGAKADIAFMLFAANLADLARTHRSIEAAFPPAILQRVYSYLSVTELPEYVTTEDDARRQIQHQDKLDPASPEFAAKLDEWRKRQSDYERYRLYPELPDWEVMSFYPMSKRRQGSDNWYSLDFDARKKLMGGHARVGRKFAGRITQLITGSTGLEEWEWGVTLVAHQLDALKDIVYEMRFDEVSARYGEFGPFYINLRLNLDQLRDHLGL